MRDRGEADLGKYNLTELRNLSPTSINQLMEFHYSEDETNRAPLPALLHEVVELTYQITSDEEWDTLKKPKAEAIVYGNETLPMCAYRQEIINAARENDIVFIDGETGSGKSTQITQILLSEHYNRIILVQPRIIAVRNIYGRTKYELAEKIGIDEAEKLISYRTADERSGPDNSKIEIVTDGLSFARDSHLGTLGEGDVLIIDEVHEGNLNVEMLLAFTKESVRRGDNVKFFIMTATADMERLADYFDDVCESRPPIIKVKGRMFPIEKFERPDSDIVTETIKAAEIIHADLEINPDAPNAIQVFVAGLGEVNDAIDDIRRKLPQEIAKNAKIFPLYADLTAAEQQAALQKYSGVNIIVCTNIGQTSITIPHIKFVIDSGEHRQMEINAEGAQCLRRGPASQADLIQRAGRASRVSAGVYVLTKPNRKESFVSFNSRPEFSVPEILRTDINRTVLRVAGIGMNMLKLDLFNPVEPSFIKRSQEILNILDSLDKNGVITSVGRQMNAFPVCVTSAKMLVEVGRYPENVRGYMAAITAAKEAGSLQSFAYNVGKRWKSLSEETSSDMLAQLDIFIASQHMDAKQLYDYDLSVKKVETARKQFVRIARKAGAFSSEILPPTLEEREQIKLCIYAGMVNSVFVRNGDGTYTQAGKPNSLPREISNRSTVRSQPSAMVGDPYRVEFFREGVRGERQTIENGTAGSLAAIGRAAVRLTEWSSEGYTLRRGKFVEVQRQKLFGVDLGVSQEVNAEPSPRLRDAVLYHALHNPGNQQRYLREIKDRLQQLGHMSKNPVQQITQDRLKELLKQAAPADITSPEVIDNNLRLIMDKQDIRLEKYISRKDQENIIQNAPKHIEYDGVILKLSYRKGKPMVSVKNNSKQYADIDEDHIYLPDGREIFFVYGKYDKHGKKYTLGQLKKNVASLETVYA